jgi:autotransporter translocation and assembly factor TamB
MNEDLRAIVDFSGATVNPRNNERSGTLRLTGTVDLTEVTDPGLDLEFDANSILAALRRDMEITASADVQIQGRYRRPRVTGNVSVERGTIYLDELYRQYLIVQFDDRLLFDLVDTADVSALPERTNPFIQNLVVEDLEATATSGLWLRSREMNVELAGSINVDLDRQIERIVITGSLEVIRGTYTLESGLLARNFQVQEGTVSFPGTPGIDPVFQITALHTARAGQEPLDIYADVTGSLSAPRVTLRSDIQPPISESDLASYLFFGAPTSQFGFASSSSLTGLLGGTVAGSALGYVASGLQTIGQSSGLVDYVGLTTAEAAPGAGSWGNFLTGTRIELGRYITPRLFLLITQPLDSPAGADDPGIRLEWRFSRTFRAEIFTDNRFARAPSIGLSQAIAARRVFGVFLFREWSY